MNRGTALKWADRLESGCYSFDRSQLRISCRGRRVYCPLGVLADFLDPDGWAMAWDGMSGLWHGEQFKIAGAGRKKAKMKTDGLDQPMQGLGLSFSDWVLEKCFSHRRAAAFGRENYRVI